MQRITITIDDDLLDAIDAMSARRGYASRSEALRDIVREVVTGETAQAGTTACIATLSYLFEHETRELARRLTAAQHDHHDLSVSTLHVHVGTADCLEVAVLKGSVDEVRRFADSVTTQRGVRMGNLHIMPLEPVPENHHHHPSDPASTSKNAV